MATAAQARRAAPGQLGELPSSYEAQRRGNSPGVACIGGAGRPRLALAVKRLRVEGATRQASLAQTLNKHGVATPRGCGVWTHTTVARVFGPSRSLTHYPVTDVRRRIPFRHAAPRPQSTAKARPNEPPVWLDGHAAHDKHLRRVV